MEGLLFESTVRSALIAAGTAVALWAFGIKTAAARHRAWSAVVLLMLLLPIWTVVGPTFSLRVLRPAPAALELTSQPVRYWVPNTVTEPVARPLETRAVAEPAISSVNWQTLLIGVYLLGACAMLARLAVGTFQARRLMRNATIQDGYLTSGSCGAPITVGWFSPVAILPSTWPQWSEAQLDAVLTHEYAHVRRHDPLVQWLALFNRAIFWFHPLAWWLERRLAALAEGACDAAVLAAGHAPQDYSEYLLDLARSTMEQGRRVAVVGMAMPGRYLPQRIRQILDGIPLTPVSRTRVACVVVLCTISSVTFAAATLSPRQVPTSDTKIEVAAPMPSTEPAPQSPASLFAREETRLAPTTPSVSQVQTDKVSSPAPVETVTISQDPAPQNPDDNLFVANRLYTVRQQEPSDAGLMISRQAVRWLPNIRWLPNTTLPDLGLTDDQRAKIDKTLENHRQNVTSYKERLDKEEAQLARLLEAEPIDSTAVLAQSDRVIQTSGEMERAEAMITLEVRQHLTQAQWVQWQQSPNRLFSYYLGYTFKDSTDRAVIRRYQFGVGDDRGTRAAPGQGQQ